MATSKIPINNDNIGNPSKGFLAVKKNGFWGLMNVKGELICPYKYKDGQIFGDKNGLFSIVAKNKTIYIYNGKVLDPKGYDATAGVTEGLTRVRNNGKRGFINRQGREVVPCIYDQANYFSSGLCAVSKGGKWFFIDSQGKKVLDCAQCEDAFGFSEGLAPVKRKGKWGYINKKGKEVIPFQFGSAGTFKDDLAPVMVNKKWGLIDTAGRLIVPYLYDKHIWFSLGYAPVKKNGKMGMINSFGREILPCIYDDVGNLIGDCIQVTQEGKVTFMNLRGEPY